MTGLVQALDAGNDERRFALGKMSRASDFVERTRGAGQGNRVKKFVTRG